ncbi:RNA polymerase sigma factor [Holophaga foetida]|uniref:RNA polymerase sigma factor n=1 Tax=Holophaga foetida TaxID=35839 RepID=UPI0002474632|nr:RNA polymerase sigma factor [Holophaga foetida]
MNELTISEAVEHTSSDLQLSGVPATTSESAISHPKEDLGADDAVIMAQVQAGQVEEFAILFERYRRHLLHFFQGVTRDVPASEDLVQDVFYRILRHRATYQLGAPFLPWMWRIARNSSADYFKSLKHHASLDGFEDMLPHGGDRADDISNRAEELECLDRALSQLSPERRELLLMTRESDLSYSDLATMKASSVSAIKSQVHRALKELRKHFHSLQGGRR